MKNNTHPQKGFITLFFILGISFTFLTWISLSSERVFKYISIKEEFTKNRLYIQDNVLCADSFINNIIKSDYNLSFKDNEYEYKRSLYYKDNHNCHIKNIKIVFENNNISKINFISDDFTFEYQFKNGFVKLIKSSDLF